MVDLVRVGDLSAISSAELSQDLHFDKYARQILENGKNVAASTPTITTLSGSEFWQKLSASLINSIPVHPLKQGEDLTSTTTTSMPMPISHMDFDIIPNRVVIDSANFGAMDELQKQLEYDKFMNEVWIGIVFTLILISMVFCICSCFLYHQFRTWKRNYNATVAQSQALDIESMKLNPDHEDPVPEYTLVSGLPSYEAALELLNKTPNSCVLLYPAVYNVFNKHEKSSNESINESSRPLMATQAIEKSALPQHNNNSNSNIPSYAEATIPTTVNMTAVTEKSAKHAIELPTAKDTPTTVTYAILQKVPSYEEALLVKSDSCL